MQGSLQHLSDEPSRSRNVRVQHSLVHCCAQPLQCSPTQKEVFIHRDNAKYWRTRATDDDSGWISAKNPTFRSAEPVKNVILVVYDSREMRTYVTQQNFRVLL